MEEKKYLGLPKNVALGISWAAFPFGIVVLCVEKAKLTKKEKAEFITPIVIEGLIVAIETLFGIIAGIINACDGNGAIANLIGLIINIPILIIWVIGLIKAFTGNYWEAPIAFGIASSFVKEGAEEDAPAEEEAKAEEAPAEEKAEEEKPEE